MYFPNDITFQYFFFDTYVGYFLQALPISILFGIIYWFIKLIYHMNSGNSIHWFNGDFDFTLDFINNISEENIGNFIMFLPFGILYPLSHSELKLKNIILNGIVFVLIIEILQPVFGRSFDINDIVLDSLGILISVSGFMIIKNIKKM